MSGAKRRQYTRVKMPGPVQGSVDLKDGTQVINLSPRGAMIEHSMPLSPGRTCFLYLRLLGVDLRLRGQVVWSEVKGNRGVAKGDRQIRFRSGVHLPDLPETDEAHIRRFLGTLGAPKPHPVSEEVQSPAADDGPSVAIPQQNS